MNDGTGPLEIDGITIPTEGGEGVPASPPSDSPEAPGSQEEKVRTRGWRGDGPPSFLDGNAGGRVFPGVYPAVVVDHGGPESPERGELRVALPWLSTEDSVELWARYVGPVGGPGAGAWLLPEADDEVLVAFEGREGMCGVPTSRGGSGTGPIPHPRSPGRAGRASPGASLPGRGVGSYWTMGIPGTGSPGSRWRLPMALPWCWTIPPEDRW